ncbi:hypothetical protein [Engelhardtia mirabilis]|uniref:Right handed beta helix domain-containing protein n=1 Tax=Engelhardtia mirabilis TaxID=2528011 RepID=A0A518BF13_9BACT|nr:hypothetical protein Pla133_06170 [Planctomycetes bacterium Pla133]QDU99878.1 hypothetical protein Pla86_06170 [Planctomycetes bacterium Pla86]
MQAPVVLTSLTTALATIALATTAAAGQVWVVDGSAAPGFDFLDIQPAVDVAAPGDVVLIRGGDYATFAIDGKGLSVLADADQVVHVDGTWRVANLPAGQLVVLRGLQTGTPGTQGLSASSCEGSLWIEDCTLTASDGPLTGVLPLHHGIRLDRCKEVVIARCEASGGNGKNLGSFGYPFGGGSGVDSFATNVAVVDSVLTGGHGASSPLGESWDGAIGGHGLRMSATHALVAGVETHGGYGGWADVDYDTLFGTKNCGYGGNGGSGIYVESYNPEFTATYSSVLTVRDQVSTPGGGGGAWCAPAGSPGQPITLTPQKPHSVTELAGDARTFFVNSPVRGGTDARLNFAGAPGDLVLAVASGGATWLDLGGQPAPLVLADVPIVLGPWQLDGSGTTIQAVPVPTQAIGFGGATLPMQAVVLEAASGALTLASPSALTVLEQGL